MDVLRARSIRMTNFLEALLQNMLDSGLDAFTIITPRSSAERGAQLSIRLKHDELEAILEHLEEHAVVIDERKPDVIRVAPAPLYNTFADVWDFCQILKAGFEKLSS
jgi:kynureninase